MLKNFFFILCVFTSFITTCVATEVNRDSIEKIENERVYLKPGSIQVAKNGIFIHVDGQLLAIDHLKKDDMGVYFESFQAGSGCPICGFPLLFGLFCINPDCQCKK